MAKYESTMLLHQLLKQDAESVLSWLRRIESGLFSPPEDFNWVGLAEAAASDACEGELHNATTPDVKWAEVATKIYDKLAAKVEPNARDSFINSSMLLRAAMIAKLGAVAGHPVLDIDPLLRWFQESLIMSPSEAAKKAGNWRKCQIEEIRELRRIKNRLKVISLLADSDKVVLNPEINSWLSLREQLA